MSHALRIMLILLLSSTLRQSPPASAFKPNEQGHLGITSEALQQIQIDLGGEKLTFSDRAVKQIRDANKAVDAWYRLGFLSSKHFDDELFDLNMTRLINLKLRVISKITAPSPVPRKSREPAQQRDERLN